MCVCVCVCVCVYILPNRDEISGGGWRLDWVSGGLVGGGFNCLRVGTTTMGDGFEERDG